MQHVEGHDGYASIADLYDWVVPYRERQDVSFYVDLARESRGPVLEVGCGTGRVLIPSARAGIEMVGIDRSRQMLAQCRQRLGQEPPNVQSRAQLVEADMRRFDLRRQFTLVTLPFRPFQHLLTVDDQLSCLATIRRHLTADGRLVLDLFNPSLDALVRQSDQEFGEEPEFTSPDGRRVVRRHRLKTHDRFSQVMQVELIYEVARPDGPDERLVQAAALRYLFRFEAEHLLARAGFEIEHLYGGFDKSPYGSTYPGELIFIARRTAA